MSVDEAQQRQIELMLKARELIGEAAKESDGNVSPKNILARVPDEFRALKTQLSTADFKSLQSEFHEADELSNKWQRRYRWAERSRIILFFVALCLGAYALSPFSSGSDAQAGRFVSIAQGAAIAIALIAISTSIGFNFFGKWREQRARAEYAKGRYFKRIAQLPPEVQQVDEIPLVLQKLELLRRYRLQHQHTYMANKVAMHERSDQRRRVLTYAAGALAFLVAVPVTADFASYVGYSGLSNAIGRISSLMLDPNQSLSLYFLAFGIVLAGLEASITNYFRIEQDLRFAAHFRDTGRELESMAFNIEGKPNTTVLDDARRAAAAGDDTKATEWLVKLEDTLFKEHQRWLEAHMGKGSPLSDSGRLDTSIV